MARMRPLEGEEGRYQLARRSTRKVRPMIGKQGQALDVRAMAFKAEIERRLASGPSTPMDFSALKRSIREEAEARKDIRQ